MTKQEETDLAFLLAQELPLLDDDMNINSFHGCFIFDKASYLDSIKKYNLLSSSFIRI